MKTFDNAFQRISDQIQSWSTRQFLIVIIAFQIIVHLPILALPPMGQHTWLQVTGLSVARNFYEEGNNLFHPRHDVRIDADDTGEIYTAFQGIFWLVGQSYHLTGFSHINGRMMALIMGLFLIIGGYMFTRALGLSEIKARWFVFFLSCSPLFFYYSITLVPNLPALTMFVWGTALIIPKVRQEKWDYLFWLGACLVSLSTLTKPTYLFFGLPIGVIFICQLLKSRRLGLIFAAFLFFLIVAVPNVLQYMHAVEIFEHAPIERQRHAELSPLFNQTTFDNVMAAIRPAIVEWFLQMFVNTAAIPIFLVGCYQAIRQKKWRSEHGLFWLAWIASFLVFSSAFILRFREHAYYMTPMLMFAAMASAYGINTLLKSRRWRGIICVLLILVPMVMVGRVYHRWTRAKQVPEELLTRSGEFQKLIPPAERVLIIGDSSPNIYLYYLHRKGVFIPGKVTRDQVDYYREKGFKWVVNDARESDIQDITDMLNPVERIGSFAVYQIR